jgi:hypothetical protein
MAVNFNGTDVTFKSVALNIQELSFQKGEVPRVDATHSASSFKTYLAGIAEADSVTTTSLVTPGTPGDTGTFTTGNIAVAGTFRLESVEESGSIDNAVTFSASYVRTS